MNNNYPHRNTYTLYNKCLTHLFPTTTHQSSLMANSLSLMGRGSPSSAPQGPIDEDLPLLRSSIIWGVRDTNP